MSALIWNDAKEIHAMAVELGAIYEDRSADVAWVGREAYEYHMTQPNPPLRTRWSEDGDAPLWLEWHRVRNIDPYAYKARGYRLAEGLRRAVIARDGYVCRLCGGDVEATDVHIDHVTPRVLGGTDELHNLQVAHSFCNISKGARVAV